MTHTQAALLAPEAGKRPAATMVSQPNGLERRPRTRTLPMQADRTQRLPEGARTTRLTPVGCLTPVGT